MACRMFAFFQKYNMYSMPYILAWCCCSLDGYSPWIVNSGDMPAATLPKATKSSVDKANNHTASRQLGTSSQKPVNAVMMSGAFVEGDHHYTSNVTSASTL